MVGILVAAGVYSRRLGRAPAGQPSAVTLHAANFRVFEEQFKPESSGAHMVLLLSPS